MPLKGNSSEPLFYVTLFFMEKLRAFVILSDEGLTLETSALKLFTVANSCYQLSWWITLQAVPIAIPLWRTSSKNLSKVHWVEVQTYSVHLRCDVWEHSRQVNPSAGPCSWMSTNRENSITMHAQMTRMGGDITVTRPTDWMISSSWVKT